MVLLYPNAPGRPSSPVRLPVMDVAEAAGRFTYEGRRLHYRVYGEGPRVTVLLHGLLLNQRMHVPLARALASRGGRVVTLDLYGHGRSDRPADMWRYGMGFFAP